MTSTPKSKRNRRAAVIAVCIACGIAAAAFFLFVSNKPAKDDGYLPKDVASTPAASPLASAPPGSDTSVTSDAVTINLPANGAVGSDTDVTGTAASPSGVVYYRISDYRRGQIAAGEVNVPAGGRQPFTFKPEFIRDYTSGDPAALDVYVLNQNGEEQLTRIPVTLR